MTTTYFGRTPWTLWWQSMLAVTALLIAGAIIFPQTIYEGFIWRYFWGPVVADGQGWSCVAYAGGAEIPCADAGPDRGATAEPGYTMVSTASYAVVLLGFLVGVYLGIERFDIDATHELFFALVPFMFLGGTMRAVEDAKLLIPEGTGSFVFDFPLTAILISPIIYFLIFFIAVATIAVGVYLSRRGVADTFEVPVAAVSSVLFLLSLAYLVYLVGLVPDNTISYPMLFITLGGATLTAFGFWWGISQYYPELNAGTGLIGPIVIWGHAVDGFANVLSLDWNEELGLGRTYDAKHVVNEAVGDITEAIQPEALSDLIGVVWPFIPLKIAVATLVVYLFDDRLFEESPRYFMLLLVAVLAVGLGPGTRDLLRAVFGI